MSLNNEDKAALEKAIARLKRTLNSLEDFSVDPVALDLIDLAMGMLERQLIMDIEFFDEDDYTNDNNCFLFLEESDDGQIQFAPQQAKTLEHVSYADYIDEESAPDDSNFMFLEEETNSNTPSSDELEQWFNIEFPE